MSDSLRHECGIAAVRLLKPLDYYERKYKNPLWGLDRLHALMLKQRNRGQDGMGIGCCKLNMQAGQPYMFRVRSSRENSMEEVFGEVMDDFKDIERKINKGRKAAAIDAHERGPSYQERPSLSISATAPLGPQVPAV